MDVSDNIVKRGRGRPKGVTNSIITVPQLQIRSPIKLRSNNRSSHSSGPSGTGEYKLDQSYLKNLSNDI